MSAASLNQSFMVCTQECVVFIKEAQGPGILPGYLKRDSQHYTRTCQIPNYMYFSHFLLGLQWNFNKTKGQGIGKKMSHIMGFHIQVIFHIIYYYMGKEYHYFVIIIFII